MVDEDLEKGRPKCAISREREREKRIIEESILAKYERQTLFAMIRPEVVPGEMQMQDV